MPLAERVTGRPAAREQGQLPLQPAQALLVLGPHRSGTSAVTRLLNLLGADIAADLLPPAPDNTIGFWESRALVELHDEVLSAQGVRWHTVRALDQGFCASARSRSFVERLAAILGRDYGRSASFVVKDPRMCRLLPLWRQALDLLAIRPSCVLVLRNPHEVAASLAARDGVPLGKGLLIWLWHILEAELDSRGLARTVVRYDEILFDWHEPADRLARDLGLTWATSPREAESAVRQFLSVDLHHQVAARLPPPTHPLTPVANRVFAVMARGCRGEPLDQAALDGVREQLRAASEIWVHLDADESREREEESARHEREIVTLRLEGERCHRRIADLEEHLAQKERRETEMASRIESLGQRLTAASECAIEALRSARNPRLLPRFRAAVGAAARRVGGRVMVFDRATRRAVEESGLFDSIFYLVSSPDLRSLAVDPYFHFIHWGGLEGRDPNPLFDSAFYLAMNPDVAAARMNPLLHYWCFGANEGRNPHPLFDTRFYRESDPSAAGNPLAHYLKHGAKEGRRAHPDRDAEARARLGL